MDRLISFSRHSWLIDYVWKVRVSELPTLEDMLEFWFNKLFSL